MNDWNKNGSNDMFDNFTDYQNYTNLNNCDVSPKKRGGYKKSTWIVLLVVFIVSLFSDTIALIILMGFGWIKLIS